MALGEDQFNEVQRIRKEKDSYFGADSDSPIPEEERALFKGLKYFPPNADYQVKAHLSKFEKPEVITMATSKGTIRQYLKYGLFQFELHGRKQQLHAYKAADDPTDHSLFVPFTDETSGKESYGAGRYLDIENQKRDDYILDFNLAYNPYCAYNEDYVCPVPPRENKLPIAVRAGEKNYK